MLRKFNVRFFRRKKAERINLYLNFQQSSTNASCGMIAFSIMLHHVERCGGGGVRASQYDLNCKKFCQKVGHAARELTTMLYVAFFVAGVGQMAKTSPPQREVSREISTSVVDQGLSFFQEQMDTFVLFFSVQEQNIGTEIFFQKGFDAEIMKN